MKRVLFVLGSMLWLAGCYPALRTVQPKVQLLVVDPNGRPVEGATFTLATYRQPGTPVLPMKLARFETDAAGAVSIARRGDWRMEALLPDGSSWYVWRYCIEKTGYRAIASQETRFTDSLTVVLEPFPRPSQCEWASTGHEKYEVKVVE